MSHTLNTTKIVTQSTATTIIHTLSLHDALPISGRLHRAHVQLRHGREIHHHLPRIPGHPSRERLVGDHRHSVERPRSDHARGREHRWRAALGARRAGATRTRQVSYAVPALVELGRDGSHTLEPRRGPDRLRATYPGAAPEGTRPGHPLPFQSHPSVAGAAG